MSGPEPCETHCRSVGMRLGVSGIHHGNTETACSAKRPPHCVQGNESPLADTPSPAPYIGSGGYCFWHGGKTSP